MATAGQIILNKVFISNAPQGTSPFVVSSTTAIAKLNAEMLNGYKAGNSSNNIPINNGILNSTLNSNYIQDAQDSDFQKTNNVGFSNVLFYGKFNLTLDEMYSNLTYVNDNLYFSADLLVFMRLTPYGWMLCGSMGVYPGAFLLSTISGGFNNITNFIFSTNVSASVRAEIKGSAISGSSAMARNASVNSPVFGYFAGGYMGANINSIMKIIPTNANSYVLSSTLPAALNSISSFESTKFGYFTGGGTDFAHTGAVNTINKLEFSTDARTTASYTLSIARTQVRGCSNTLFGITFGGIVTSQYNYKNTIEYITFSSDTITTSSETLTVAKTGGAGYNSTSAGYYANGKTGSGTSVVANNVDKFIFSNLVLFTSKVNLGAIDYGICNATGFNSSVTGYSYNGTNASDVNINVASTLTFSNDTVNSFPSTVINTGFITSAFQMGSL